MKTFKLPILAGSITALIALSGCSSIKVTTDYDRSAPFGVYRTYALEPPAKVPPLSPTVDAALRESLREHLGARAIREIAPNENPELAVVPHVSLQQRYSVQQYTSWGYGPGMWPYSRGFYGVWVGAPFTYNTITSYTEGTLILDFVDAATQRLVFRGTATSTVTRDSERNANKVREAVGRIVARMPRPQTPPVAGNL
jgi:hypothetical protein